VSFLMLVVVILFAPTLLGFALLASRLEARFLDPPGTVPGIAGGVATAPARRAGSKSVRRGPAATPGGPDQV
jgi:hypothetical protein